MLGEMAFYNVRKADMNVINRKNKQKGQDLNPLAGTKKKISSKRRRRGAIFV